MRRVFVALAIVVSGGIAVAAEPAEPKKTDKVDPAKYRILVKYDKYTLDAIRQEIRKEVEKGLEARRRRLAASEDELKSQVKKELEKYQDELEAIKKARDAERTARERGDLSEAERWRLLRLQRTYQALELARRAKRVQEALLALSLENWRRTKRKERAIAEKALRRLDAMLEQLRAKERAERRERGRAVVPPHE